MFGHFLLAVSPFPCPPAFRAFLFSYAFYAALASFLSRGFFLQLFLSFFARFSMHWCIFLANNSQLWPEGGPAAAAVCRYVLARSGLVWFAFFRSPRFFGLAFHVVVACTKYALNAIYSTRVWVQVRVCALCVCCVCLCVVALKQHKSRGRDVSLSKSWINELKMLSSAAKNADPWLSAFCMRFTYDFWRDIQF